MSTEKSILSLVEAQELVCSHGEHVFATSLSIAERFGKQHKDVLRAIKRLPHGEFWRRNFAPRDYVDDRGKVQPMYEITRDGFSLLAMRFTGPAALEWQLKYIEAFNLMEAHVRKQFADPPRADILRDKRQSHNPMMAALIELREEQGKTTDARHYMCENKLCNWAVTGEFRKIDESTLSNDDAELLKLVRDRDRAYLLAGLDYETRKKKLTDFATRYRTKLIAV